MVVKVFFDECSVPFWIDIANRLKNQHNWEPCYWTGDPGFEQHVKKVFPNVIFHSNLDAIKGIPASSYKDLELPVLDQIVLRNLAYCESITLHMMNRMDRNGTFSFEERDQLFKRYVRYWSAIIDKHTPDVVVFPVSPHLIYDYVLYYLCKQKKIHTILFEQTSLDGWIYPEEHFEDGSTQLKNNYQKLVNMWKLGQLKNISLSDDATLHLKKLTSDYSAAVPFYMKDQFEQNNIPLYLIKQILFQPNYLPQMLKKGKYLLSRGHYIKQQGKNIQESNVTGLEYVFSKINGMKKKNQLKKHYSILAKSPEFNTSYLYFPLHYQPENTSCPLGETFVDQYLIIDMLSKYVPLGWKIYIKEHTSQWHPKMHGECSRTTDFYDKVALLPNTQFVPISTPNFELIDHSKAVVTITGTAGWEAVVRGKPTLIFGHAWYKYCEGVFYVPSLDECKNTLQKIQAGYTIDHELIRLFLSAVQQIGVNAYVEPSYAKIVPISSEENILRLTTAIYSFFTKNTEKTINSIK